MGKYNLGNLDPLEFEDISAEILSIIKNSKFRTFKAGKDSGIDALELETCEKTILQAKRYNDFDKLFNVLKKEKEKIDKNPEIEDYYLFTSYSLNPMQLKKIFNLFSGYMKNYENIYDGKMISDFLDDPQHVNILMKHPCLWLSNVSIFEYILQNNIMIDGDVLLADIVNNDKYYVDNSYFKKCKEALMTNNSLLILGAAGVGKTTISNKIVLFLLQNYKTQNIQLRYSSRYEYEDLKKAISRDPNVFEIIYIDDFIGKVCLDITARDTSGLISLIKFVKTHKNKFLVMNSRITILNNKYEKDSEFKKCIIDNNIGFVEIGEYSDIEKARILFKRLKNDLPIDYRKEIIKDRRYWKIINHPNYNPRTIENMCRQDVLKKYSPDKYFDYVMKSLKDSSELWKEEYRGILEKEDKILLDTIFSLANKGTVDIKYVEKAFYHVIKKEKIKENGDNLFNNSIERLSHSYLTLVFDENSKIRRVSFINNSLFDYFNKMIEDNPVYKESLLENSVFADQLVNIAKWDIKNKCKNLNVYSFINDNLSDDFIVNPKIRLQVLKIRDTYDITSEDSFIDLSNILLCSREKYVDDYYVNSFLLDLFNNSDIHLVETYFINKFKKDINSFELLCLNTSYEVVGAILKIWAECDNNSYEECFDSIEEIILSNYEPKFIDLINDAVVEEINNAIASCHNAIRDYDVPGNEDDIRNELIDLAWDNLCSKREIFSDSRLNPDFSLDDIVYEVDSINLSEEIRNYYYEPDYKGYLEDQAYNSDYHNTDSIDNMFYELAEE